ncbi:MAG: hypothetical protein FJZ96_14590 [Chloroflexi bacterium]|nr:hypothetical protein [Chloroflexota bacterium]
MKRIHIPALFIVFALFLASCSGTAAAESTVPASSDAYISPGLDTGYEGALSARLQLTLGSLYLAETTTPITPEQAALMLPLWEGLRNLTSSGNSAQAEVNAILVQIESLFTIEQLDAISDMQLVSADMQAWMQANGLPQGSGTGQPGAGQGGGLSPEARATKQAAEGITAGSNGGNGASTAILDALIAYLHGLAE